MVDINLQLQNQNFSQWMEAPIANTINFMPNLIGALIILFIGWIAGRIVGSIVGRITNRVGLDRSLRSTPLGRVSGDGDHEVANIFNLLARWLVYGIAILAAANVLAIPALSQWLTVALTYLPVFIGGVLIIVLGFILADFIGNMIERTHTAGRAKYTFWIADAARIALYFVAIVVGLGTMGVDVTILYILAIAAAGGLAIGLALAIGIGFGWGIKDYVDNHIDHWARKAKNEAEEMER